MAVTPRPLVVDQRIYLWSAFALGFFLQFNPVPTAWHIPVPRFSQLMMLPCIAFLVHRLLRREGLPGLFYCALMVLFTFLHLAAGGISLAFGANNTDLFVSVAYILYLIGGVGLYMVLAQRGCTTWFCWGILIGALLSLVVFAMEANGLTSLAKSLGLTQEAQKIQRVGTEGSFSRLTGMWGHANAVGHVLAIAAPAAGYLFVSKRERLPLFLLAIIMGASFYYTANRGGLIAVAVTMIAMLFARRESIATQRRSLLVTVAGLGVLAYGLYFLPAPDFIYARITDGASIDTNAQGRFATTFAGFRIGLEHPFGMGVDEWRAALLVASGFVTPHNGFIAIEINLGVAFLFMLLWALVTVVIAGLRKPRKLSLDIFLMLAAVQMSVSCLFEEVSNIDTFMMIIALIMARVFSGVVNLSAGPRSRQAGPVRRAEADPQAQSAT